MTILKRVCDRCGSEIPENKNNLKNHYTVSHYGDSVVVPDKDYDLCDDCEKKLIEWLNLSEIEEVNQVEE